MKTFNHESGKHIKIKGARIYFEEHNPTSKDILLFLHGGFGNIEDFNDIIPMLDKQYRIIGIDSRGQGKSTLGEEILTYERIQRDVELVLEHLSIDKLSILGFSDGGTVAYRLACFSPLQIDKLITIGASWHSRLLQGAKEILSSITAEKWKAKFPETYKKYQSINPEPDFDKLTNAIVQMWLDETESGHPDEHLQKVKCPLLIVRGDNDHLVSKETVFKLSDLIENSHLANIPFAGHEAHVDQKNVLMNIVNEFLDR